MHVPQATGSSGLAGTRYINDTKKPTNVKIQKSSNTLRNKKTSVENYDGNKINVSPYF